MLSSEAPQLQRTSAPPPRAGHRCSCTRAQPAPSQHPLPSTHLLVRPDRRVLAAQHQHQQAPISTELPSAARSCAQHPAPTFLYALTAASSLVSNLKPEPPKPEPCACARPSLRLASKPSARACGRAGARWQGGAMECVRGGGAIDAGSARPSRGILRRCCLPPAARGASLRRSPAQPTPPHAPPSTPHLQVLGHRRAALLERLDQVWRVLLLVGADEGDGGALGARAPRAPHAARASGGLGAWSRGERGAWSAGWWLGRSGPAPAIQRQQPWSRAAHPRRPKLPATQSHPPVHAGLVVVGARRTRPPPLPSTSAPRAHRCT